MLIAVFYEYASLILLFCCNDCYCRSPVWETHVLTIKLLGLFDCGQHSTVFPVVENVTKNII